MTTNILDMSDEEFEKMAVPDFTSEEYKNTDEGESEEDDDLDEEEPDDDPEEDDPESDPEPDKDKEEDPEPGDEGNEPEDKDDPEPEKKIEDKEKEVDPKDVDKEKDTGTGETDWKTAYESLMAPFKANGTEFTPKSPEDLIRLAQMGVNYHDKMAGMKPARTALKTLENNDLLDEGKLATLIDASNGDIGAITKLIKDHGINPLDLDTKVDSTYVPNNHSPSEEELALDTVLDSIKGSPAYDKTADIISNQWDGASQKAVATDPHIISVINEHVGSGVYDKVMNEVKYQRSLGGLTGVSDLVAYKHVGNELINAGAFTDPATSEKKAGKEESTKQVDPKTEKDRLAKKKAASSTKASGKKSGKLPSDFNPLSLSDEEFAKFDPKQIGIK